jgi:hypothetical protein
MTTTLQGFHPVAEVTADDRARIAFGKAGVHKDDRFLVSTADDGTILLTPLASIPKRELIIWENEELRESLLRGLADAHVGKVSRRDDFLDAEDDD